MDFQSVQNLLVTLGLPAIFLLTMVEGDITLLLAGVLAHGQAFGEYSFPLVLTVGTLAGVASDNVAYALGRAGRSSVKKYRFYCAARPRLAKMKYPRFLVLSFASCFVWVLMLSGAGFIFHSAIYNLIGDIHNLSYFLLVVVVAVIVLGIAGFYFAEKYWLSKKVEEASPEAIQKFEQAAEEKLHEIKDEIQELIPHPLARHKESPKQKSKAEGD